MDTFGCCHSPPPGASNSFSRRKCFSFSGIWRSPRLLMLCYKHEWSLGTQSRRGALWSPCSGVKGIAMWISHLLPVEHQEERPLSVFCSCQPAWTSQEERMNASFCVPLSSSSLWQHKRFAIITLPGLLTFGFVTSGFRLSWSSAGLILESRYDSGVPVVVTRAHCGNESALTGGNEGPDPTLTGRSFPVDLTVGWIRLPRKCRLSWSSSQLL